MLMAPDRARSEQLDRRGFSRAAAALVAAICGAELFVLAIVGGVGLSAVFGFEGAFVGALALALVVSRRRRQKSLWRSVVGHVG